MSARIESPSLAVQSPGDRGHHNLFLYPNMIPLVMVLSAVAGVLLVLILVFAARKLRKCRIADDHKFVGGSPRTSSSSSSTSVDLASVVGANKVDPRLSLGSSMLACMDEDDLSYSSSRVSSSRYSSLRRWFNFKELEEASQKFSEKNRITGGTSRGAIYRGVLSGRRIAIKLLKTGVRQEEQEFRTEFEILNRVHHKHIVNLLGFCMTDAYKILVYDYVPNGSLDNYLHETCNEVLDWSTRERIAIQTATALAYLHEDCHPQIMHQDITTANILLGNKLQAVISGFGMAAFFLDFHSSTTGYSAESRTRKSDIYAFGMILLELITGCRSEGLVRLTRPLLNEQKLQELVDPKLTAFDENGMLRMMKVAEACTHPTAAVRPSMLQVVHLLDGSNPLREGEHYYLSDETSEYGLTVSISSSSESSTPRN